MYIFKYNHDNMVQRDNGAHAIPLEDFIKKNPHVPIVEGEYFELTSEGILLIDKDGYGNWGDVNKYKKLIDAINEPPAPKESYDADTNLAHYMELDNVERTEKRTDKIAVSFSINEKRKQVWQYREKTEDELSKEARLAALEKIVRLEREITERRMREALLRKDAGWLAKQEKKIEKERKKL